jgi:hypothetical protein
MVLLALTEPPGDGKDADNAEDEATSAAEATDAVPEQLGGGGGGGVAAGSPLSSIAPLSTRNLKNLFKSATKKVKLSGKALKAMRAAEEEKAKRAKVAEEEEEAKREIEEVMHRRLRLALLFETASRLAKRRRVARLLAKALLKRAVDKLPVAESLAEWRAVLRTTRHEATTVDDASGHTREDREDAMRRMWVYAALPAAREGFDDEGTLEVVMRLLLEGAANRDVLLREAARRRDRGLHDVRHSPSFNSLDEAKKAYQAELDAAAAAVAAAGAAAKTAGRDGGDGTTGALSPPPPPPPPPRMEPRKSLVSLRIDEGGEEDRHYETNVEEDCHRESGGSSAMYDDPAEREAMMGLECALNIMWQLVTVAAPRTWFIANGAVEVVLSLLGAGGLGPSATPAWFSRPSLALLATCARLPEVGAVYNLNPVDHERERRLLSTLEPVM